MARTESGTHAHTKDQPYRCFLVRCWLEEDRSPEASPTVEPAWRFTVQQIGPMVARRSFTSLHDVAAHLETELAPRDTFAQEKTNKP